MSHRQKQFHFDGFAKIQDCFGGSLLNGSNAKTRRPLDSKFPIHLVLRAEKSLMRLPKTFSLTNMIVAEVSKKHGVTMYKYANVGNHLHLVITIPRRSSWSGYIRELTGKLAQRIKISTGAAGKFWLVKPFTRIVRSWQKAFHVVIQYVVLNTMEAEGHITRKEAESLKTLRSILRDGGMIFD